MGLISLHSEHLSVGNDWYVCSTVCSVHAYASLTIFLVLNLLLVFSNAQKAHDPSGSVGCNLNSSLCPKLTIGKDEDFDISAQLRCYGESLKSLIVLECWTQEECEKKSRCLNMTGDEIRKKNAAIIAEIEQNPQAKLPEDVCFQLDAFGTREKQAVLEGTKCVDEFLNGSGVIDTTEECLEIQINYHKHLIAGLVSCTTTTGIQTIDHVYRTVGMERYELLSVNKLDAIDIHPQLSGKGNLLYVTEKVPILCMVRNICCQGPLRVSYLDELGMKHELENTTIMNVDYFPNAHRTYVYIPVTIAADWVGLVCEKQLYNSDEWVSSTYRFKTKHGIMPQINKSRINVSPNFVYGDENRELECVAVGDPTPRTNWNDAKRIPYYNPPDGLEVLSTEERNVTRAVIKFKKVDHNIPRTHICISSSDIGEDEITVNISVYSSPPNITTKNVHMMFTVEDRNQSLACRAVGGPVPNIRWMYNGLFQLDIGDCNDTSTSVTHTTRESILAWPTASKQIQGNYTCIAYNIFGDDAADFVLVINDKEPDASDHKLLTGLSISIALIVFGFLCLSALFWVKYSKAKRELRDLTQQEVDEFHKGDPALLAAANDNPEDIQDATARPFNPQHEVAIDDLDIEESRTLGEGQFGMVVGGRLKGVEVAVKSTKKNAQVGYFKALLDELKIMAYVGNHENVVAFLGAVTTRIQERIVYIIVEFSPLGDLESFLRKNRENFVSVREGTTEGLEVGYQNVETKMTTRNLVSWSQQIASGMAYLGSRKVLHGDLATRNILMFPDDVVKITDFGLSRMLHNYEKYIKKSKTPVPWRWLAYETLVYREFSVMSDVWSFGVTMWEIFELGKVPYATHQWNADFTRRLADGMRLGKPNLCPADVYEVMLSCWNPKPESRMCFENLRSFFLGILDQFPQVPVTAISNYENSCSSKSDWQVPQVSLHK